MGQLERPTRKGYVLTYDAELQYQNWLELGGCTCPFTCPPCSSCTHEGHPYSLEEDDEAWELEEEEMSREQIVNKAGSNSGDPPESEYLKWGDWKEGDEVVFCGFTERGHTHWAFQVGKTYIVRKDYGSLAPESDRGEVPMQDWGFKFKKAVKPTRASQHTAYVKFPDYRKTYAYILPDSIYEEIRGYKDVKLQVSVTRENRTGSKQEIKVVHLVEVKVNYVDPVATKEIVGLESAFNPQRPKSKVTFDDVVEINVNSHVRESVRSSVMTSAPLGEIHNEWKSKQTNNFINKQEESNMSNANRRVVNVKLLDNDSGLPVEYSLVAQFDNIVTEDSNEVTVQEILLNKNIADAIAKHNQKRVEQTNLEILNRTGNEVKLRQVKLKDLTWIVTTA